MLSTATQHSQTRTDDRIGEMRWRRDGGRPLLCACSYAVLGVLLAAFDTVPPAYATQIKTFSLYLWYNFTYC
jgi:hypothetical protein